MKEVSTGKTYTEMDTNNRSTLPSRLPGYRTAERAISRSWSNDKPPIESIRPLR
jgi:hypothetical protein